MIVKELIKAVWALFAASLIGNWFLSESKKAKILGKPWYAPYFSIPGAILLTIILVLPVIYKLFIMKQ